MELNNETLQLAKAFEGMTLSKGDAVSKFGTEEQKRHFEKYKKFTNKKIGAALLKTLNQLFETVDDEAKVGRGKGYQLGKVREEVAERSTGKNATNGNWNGSTKHLDALMLAHLEHNLSNGREIQKSFVNWLLEFNMINEAQKDLYQSKYNRFKKEDTDELIKNSINSSDVRVVDHSYNFFMNDISKQRETMMSSLKRMEREGIIETFTRHKAHLNEAIENTKGEKIEVISIEAKTYQHYVNAKRRIKEKYNLSEDDVNYRTFKPSKETIENVKKYKKELKNFLENELIIEDSYGTEIEASVSNLWEELAIVVKATQKKSMEYLHKYHSEILVEYQIHKYEKFLSVRATDYKGNRTEERLVRADNSKDRYVNQEIEKDNYYNENTAFGRDNHMRTNAVLEFKEDFMKAIEVLDEIFGDKFIIDEEKIRQTLNK